MSLSVMSLNSNSCQLKPTASLSPSRFTSVVWVLFMSVSEKTNDVISLSIAHQVYKHMGSVRLF